MYRRILVPLDGSNVAEQVLPYVRELAGASQCSVELLRAFEPEFRPQAADIIDFDYLERISNAQRGLAETYLNRIAGTLQELGVPVSCSTPSGEPASCIIDEAQKDSRTLIAMATHGRSGATRWLLGSVTNKVLASTLRPLLIIRAKADGRAAPTVKLKKVLVPLDGSPVAEQVLPHVQGLATDLGLKVVLVRVTPTAEAYGSPALYKLLEGNLGSPAGLKNELAQKAAAESALYLQGLAEKLRQQGVSSVEELNMQGQPAGTIVDLAREDSDNLVAMTTHGRSGVERWLLGSVTDRVVRYSGSPVLVIRAVEEGSEDYPNMRIRPV